MSNKFIRGWNWTRRNSRNSSYEPTPFFNKLVTATLVILCGAFVISSLKNGLSISKAKDTVDTYNQIKSLQDANIHKDINIKSDYVDTIIDYLKDKIDFGIEDVVILARIDGSYETQPIYGYC